MFFIFFYFSVVIMACLVIYLLHFFPYLSC
jgi:hypothetical protein